MCGVAGFVDFSRATGREAGEQVAARMAGAIAHRGPDDAGVWSDPAAGVFLAHRRLSIVDLSPAGHQPMASASRRFVIAFNGEIYNHAALRRRLESEGRAPAWRGHSDTEVLLAAVEAWGLVPALERFVGMFSFALWDEQGRELILARDRAGEKPLYWGRGGSVLLFGSELRALRAHPAFRADVDREALALFLRHSCVPAPHSVYAGIAKLEPGTFVRIDGATGQVRKEWYWSAHTVALAAQADPWRGSDAEAADELERLLGDAVAQQLVADVPVGAFLSGGIDSSTVVALAQAKSSQPVRTFTIGFEEEAYNEAKYARAVARHLGTAHTELYVSHAEAEAVVPQLPGIYDEPFADASQIPTFLVARLARGQVTVSLSGDGGDELFAGYDRHVLVSRLWRVESSLPRAVNSAMACGLRAVGPRAGNRLGRQLSAWMPRSQGAERMGERLYKLSNTLRATSPEDIYRNWVHHWLEETVVIGAEDAPFVRREPQRGQPRFKTTVEEQAWLDFIGYLPDDILVKVDRAAMAVGLESRVPLLDHRVIEFAWCLPLAMKVRAGTSKWLLRQVLHRHVPGELVDRPKMGFAIPLAAWLRGPLRDWAEALLDESRLTREGYFHPAPIAARWREHIAGSRNWEHWLWDVLMFQAWLEAR